MGDCRQVVSYDLGSGYFRGLPLGGYMKIVDTAHWQAWQAGYKDIMPYGLLNEEDYLG